MSDPNCDPVPALGEPYPPPTSFDAFYADAQRLAREIEWFEFPFSNPFFRDRMRKESPGMLDRPDFQEDLLSLVRDTAPLLRRIIEARGVQPPAERTLYAAALVESCLKTLLKASAVHNGVGVHVMAAIARPIMCKFKSIAAPVCQDPHVMQMIVPAAAAPDPLNSLGTGMN